MPLDIDAIRAQFPALAEGAAHFDGPGGSQTPRAVAEAVAATMTAAIANRGNGNPAQRRAERVVRDARQALADLLGADPRGVIFGRSMTALTFELSRTLAAGWGPGDEVVVSELDHDANIRPWVLAAQAAGATVRVAQLDPGVGDLTLEAVQEVVTERTRLVAVTGASNLVGARPDVAAICALAHGVGALTYVDGVHLTPHAAVDMATLGADFYACSPYKFFGPHCGAVAAAPALLETLHPDKLAPSSNDVPERFELGTPPYELLAGVTAAVDVIAALAEEDPEQEITRRQRIHLSMSAVETHEDGLRHTLERGLADVEGLRFHSGAVSRTPTVLFTVAGVDSAELSRELAEQGVNAPAGSFYALEASRALGLGDTGGIRAGIAPYTSIGDVERLVAGVHHGVRALRG